MVLRLVETPVGFTVLFAAVFATFAWTLEADFTPLEAEVRAVFGFDLDAELRAISSS